MVLIIENNSDMKIITLVENRKSNEELICKHGLSIYIEVGFKKILFDLGPDDSFYLNAKKLGIKVKDIDYLVISHGHSDHGGGLKKFLEVNRKAKIILSKDAFLNYSARLMGVFYINIGIDRVEVDDRFVFVDEFFTITEGIEVFHSKKRENKLRGNKRLYKKLEGKRIRDDFSHEISLSINNRDKNYLFSACSHSGIINIIDTFKEYYGKDIDVLFAGMHLFDPVNKRVESDKFIKDLSQKLLDEKMEMYYTFHCTGEKAFFKMKEILGEKLGRLKTGDLIEY